MIYLIRSAALKDKDDLECTDFEIILKIGYTKDDSKKSRFNCYITENPTCQVLYLIQGGTEQDERNLHYHFRKYKKNYSNEWFSYEQEILNFFKTHTTKESLEKLKPYHGKPGHRTYIEYYKEFNRLLPILSKKYVSKVLSSLEVSEEYLETIVNLPDKLRELLEWDLDLDRIDNYFKTAYPDIDFSKEVSLSSEISKEIDKIDTDLTIFQDKIKYIYSLNYDKDIMKLILDNISDLSFAKYYYSIPASRAGTLGYQKGNLEKEYNSIKSCNIDLIVEEIKSKFIVGQKYSKFSIKETLRIVYKISGYSKTPKANDLKQYFEIKECKVLNKATGKHDPGFKILKLKDYENSTV